MQIKEVHVCGRTFAAGQRVAPLSFVLALQHRLPHQVETRIAGQLHLGTGTHLHSGGMQMGHGMLQLGAVWRKRVWVESEPR